MWWQCSDCCAESSAMWGLMARGCAEIGANVGQEMVTSRPWAVEVVTVTDADTSTTTETWQKALES